MQTFDRDKFLADYGIVEHPTIGIYGKLAAMMLHVSGKWWIAGGAIRALLTDTPVTTDYDIFFSDKETFDIMKKGLLEAKAVETASTEHHVTFDWEGKKVQLIRIGYYPNAESLLDTFDYTICQFAINGNRLFCGDTSLWDLARRKLVVHRITFGVASTRRMLKYAKQGFTACAGCINALLLAVAENPNVIQANVEYVD